MELKSRVVQSLAALDELAPSWSALLDRGGNVFRTPEWQRSWLLAMEGRAEPAVLAIEDGEGRLRGVLPMARFAHGLELAGWGGPASGDHLGLVCDPAEHTEVWSCAAAWLDGELRRVRRVRLAALEDGPTAAAVVETARARGWSLREVARDVTPFTELGASLAEWEKTLSSNRRQQLRRRRRRFLEAHPSARFATNDEERPIEDVLAEMTRMHTALWESRGRPGNLGRDRTQRFLRAFVAAAPGWVRFHQLWVDDRMAAVILVLHWGDVASYYQSGWDTAFAKHAVGDLMLYHSIERAIDEGLGRFDFLRGDEPYKDRYGTQKVWEPTYDLAATPAGRLALAAGRLRTGLVRTVRRTLPPRVVRLLERLRGR